MLKSKAYEEYAKWWDYWMSKIPQSPPIAVQRSPAKKDSNVQFSEQRARLLRQTKGTTLDRNLTDPDRVSVPD
jgi:hypothetical protein